MPKVLITGLNGFLAVHVANIFLNNGWTVRGTVRSESKGKDVKALPVFEGKDVEYVVLEDLIEGDFSKALQGIDAVAHVASPWHLNGETWAEYRDPAVKGTINVLEQAAKITSIKAISVTSSFAAVGDCTVPFNKLAGTIYAEEDWAPLSEETAESLRPSGDGQAQGYWYCMSKKLAEEAAYQTAKDVDAKYALSTVCPPVINGPAIHLAKGQDPTKADISTQNLYATFAAGKDATPPPTYYTSWVDVRNVAEAIFASLDKQKSGRFNISNGTFDFQTLSNIANDVFPELKAKGVIPVGNPSDRPSVTGTYHIDGSKAERELGIHYYTIEENVKATVNQFIAVGAINA